MYKLHHAEGARKSTKGIPDSTSNAAHIHGFIRSLMTNVPLFGSQIFNYIFGPQLFKEIHTTYTYPASIEFKKYEEFFAELLSKDQPHSDPTAAASAATSSSSHATSLSNTTVTMHSDLPDGTPLQIKWCFDTSDTITLEDFRDDDKICLMVYREYVKSNKANNDDDDKQEKIPIKLRIKPGRLDSIRQRTNHSQKTRRQSEQTWYYVTIDEFPPNPKDKEEAVVDGNSIDVLSPRLANFLSLEGLIPSTRLVKTPTPQSVPWIVGKLGALLTTVCVAIYMLYITCGWLYAAFVTAMAHTLPDHTPIEGDISADSASKIMSQLPQVVQAEHQRLDVFQVPPTGYIDVGVLFNYVSHLIDNAGYTAAEVFIKKNLWIACAILGIENTPGIAQLVYGDHSPGSNIKTIQWQKAATSKTFNKVKKLQLFLNQVYENRLQYFKSNMINQLAQTLLNNNRISSQQSDLLMQIMHNFPIELPMVQIDSTSGPRTTFIQFVVRQWQTWLPDFQTLPQNTQDNILDAIKHAVIAINNASQSTHKHPKLGQFHFHGMQLAGVEQQLIGEFYLDGRLVFAGNAKVTNGQLICTNGVAQNAFFVNGAEFSGSIYNGVLFGKYSGPAKATPNKLILSAKPTQGNLDSSTAGVIENAHIAGQRSFTIYPSTNRGEGHKVILHTVIYGNVNKFPLNHHMYFSGNIAAISYFTSTLTLNPPQTQHEICFGNSNWHFISVGTSSAYSGNTLKRPDVGKATTLTKYQKLPPAHQQMISVVYDERQNKWFQVMIPSGQNELMFPQLELSPLHPLHTLSKRQASLQLITQQANSHIIDLEQYFENFQTQKQRNTNVIWRDGWPSEGKVHELDIPGMVPFHLSFTGQFSQGRFDGIIHIDGQNIKGSFKFNNMLTQRLLIYTINGPTIITRKVPNYFYVDDKNHKHYIFERQSTVS